MSVNLEITVWFLNLHFLKVLKIKCYSAVYIFTSFFGMTIAINKSIKNNICTNGRMMQ
jgi:hypothetical protein